MPEEQLLIPRAKAEGEWHGLPVHGEGRVRLHQRGLVLAWAGGDGTSEWRVPFTELSGVMLRGGALVLCSRGGNVTLTSNYTLAGLWRELLDRACALPELARGARTVGSRRGGDPATQARFFAPLLEARRRA
jgi:hypothetical protein